MKCWEPGTAAYAVMPGDFNLHTNPADGITLFAAVRR
jgi:hypothetical protein